MNRKNFFLSLLGILFMFPLFSMEKKSQDNLDLILDTKGDSYKKLFQKIFIKCYINGKKITTDVKNRKKPISQLFEAVKEKKFLFDTNMIKGLTKCLNNKKIFMKKHASLALFVISIVHNVLKAQDYANWSSQVTKINFNFRKPQVAPDGTMVYIIGNFEQEGSMIYALQPASYISRAVKYLKVSEKWICLKGKGKFALRNKKIKGKDDLDWVVHDAKPGSIFTINKEVPYQFKNCLKSDLIFAVLSRPPYVSNKTDAVIVPGYWKRNK